MDHLMFEELETAEELDWADYGATFGICFIGAIVVYAAVAAT